MARRFLRENYNEICRWYDSWGMSPPQMSDLSTYGLYVPQTAAGFLVLTDSSYGILEYYITNPESLTSDRDRALDEITLELIEYGRKFGLKHFKADTKIKAIGDRAMRHGFENMGEITMYFLKGDK